MTRSPLEELIANDEAREPDTFVYVLHEESRFDETAFWRYYRAVQALADERKRGAPLDDATARAIVRTSQHVLRSLIWHFLPTDTSEIKNLDVARIDAFVERLTRAVDGYFGAYVLDDAMFRSDGLSPDS